MFFQLLAMVDMRGNLIAGVAVLVIGTVLLRVLSPNHGRSGSQTWMPIVALIAGPAVGIGFWGLYVFLIAPNHYVFPSDYFELLLPFVLVGAFVGVVAAVAFASVRVPKSDLSPPKRSRRRWNQFTVESLLVLTAAVAAVLGLWMIYVEPYRTQARAAAALRELGATVTVEPAGPRWLRRLAGKDRLVNVTECSITGTRFAGADLELLRGLTNLRTLTLVDVEVAGARMEPLQDLTSLQRLNLLLVEIKDAELEHLKNLTTLQVLFLRPDPLLLNRSHVTDAGLKHLEKLTNLRSLCLWDTDVTDVGLARLKRLANLQSLILRNVKVTDAGLAHLKMLANLQTLNLGGTQVTDAGLAHLGRRSTLRFLDLHGTKVTDAGLAHLKYLYKLRELYLAGTDVTDAGVAYLQETLPQLYIER